MSRQSCWLIVLFWLVGGNLAVAWQTASGRIQRIVPGVQLSAVQDLVVEAQVVEVPDDEPMMEDPPEISPAESEPDPLVQKLISQPLTRNPGELAVILVMGENNAQQLKSAPASESDESEKKLPPPPAAFAPDSQSIAAAAQSAKSLRTDFQVRRFRRDVLMGNWSGVAETINQLNDEGAEKVFDHLLQSLAAGAAAGMPVPANQSPAMMQQQMSGFVVMDDSMEVMDPAMLPGGVAATSQYLTPQDVVAIADLSRDRLEAAQIAQLGSLLRSAVQQGFSTDELVAVLKQGGKWLGGATIAHRIDGAKLLHAAGLPMGADQLLPSFDELDRNDVELLLAFGKHATTMFELENKPVWLDRAWSCYQMVVDHPSPKKPDQLQALEQLILLTHRVDKSVGQHWFDAVFSSDAAEARRVVALLVDRTLNGMLTAPHDPTQRLNWIKLQQQAIERWLADDEEISEELGRFLTITATAWLKESQLTINQARFSMGNAYMQIDMYGNYYWVDPNQMNANSGDQPMPIAVRDLVESRPHDRWVAAIDSQLRLAFPKMIARLHFKADEEDQAFPYIEIIAQDDPRAGKELVEEFLDTWTRNHDPNSQRRMQNRYIYFYGFEQKADSIPLTRSKQERNLAELSDWVQRIRKLPIEEIDEDRLARAFTTCHSSAEVFKLTSLRAVFGDVETLKPETVAAICQTMRNNLATVWRSVRQQEASQTNRREPEIQQQVIRGYVAARLFAQSALEKAPNSWQLQLALACLAHDENDYQQSVQKSSEFSERREAIFDLFALAAAEYTKQLPQLDKKHQSTDVFDYWFYASLGAVDLGRITAETTTDPKQFARIRTAIESLPGEHAQEVMGEFANNMFTRMSPIKPELKYRYLKGGFEIVGDHPRAIEAQKLFTYYNDLITEIQLVAQLDGGDVVGHSQPFGVYLSIRHTAEIERESAGFSKYVQNQNNMMYAYNYGRPTEDYRDKFETNVKEAWSEHFEILSMAFENPKSMRSREDGLDGWRLTPYAFVVLKSKGPHVDRLPAVKLDLDFLDTSGYAVIPVHSDIVPIDSSPSQVADRPCTELNVVQTLDERQASEGKLILEIKATAKGMVPELESVLDLKFDGFSVASVDGQPVMPTEFDEMSEAIVVNTDRSWRVELTAVDATPRGEFQFAGPRQSETTVTYQRYEDADLVEVAQTVDLEYRYNRRSNRVAWILIPALVAGGLGVFAFAWLRRKPVVVQQRVQLPDEINPFTVLMLLRRIRGTTEIQSNEQSELAQEIDNLERYYFDRTNGHAEPDLQRIARDWVARINN